MQLCQGNRNLWRVPLPEMRLATAMLKEGCYRDSVMDGIVFLDGPDGKPSQGVHVLRAG